MIIEKTDIPDVVIITPRVFSDTRGFFMETWNQKVFTDAGINVTFVQDNHSKSSYGTLRGLHYQIENTQGKLVRATVGEVFDIAVDIRKSSPTFGKWVGVILSAENKKIFWVPPGFAHGFLVLSETAEFQYKCTDIYNPSYERCIAYNDETLSIVWPKTDIILLSEKDKKGIPFSAADYLP